MRVLIAEDDPKNRKLVRDILKANGFFTLDVTNGQEAINAAITYQPHLILMDIQMPVMDGIESMIQIKKNDKTRNIPIILISASVMPDDKQMAYNAGCDGFIEKPIIIKNLLNELSRHACNEGGKNDAQTHNPDR